MKKSIRYRILRWFLFFALITILIVVPTTMQYFREKQEVTNTVYKLEQTHILYLQKLKNQQSFLSKDKSNPQFFISNNSGYLDKVSHFHDGVTANFNDIINNDDLEEFRIRENLAKARQLFSRQDSLFQVMVSALRKRGFKDYGLVGEMRKNVHKLEKYPRLDQTKVLSLRRHEKDFIIRHSNDYIKKHKQLGEAFLQDIRQNPSFLQREKDTISKFLTNYLSLFQEVTQLDKKIWYDSESLTNRFQQISDRFEVVFNEMISQTKSRRSDIFRELQYYYILFTIALLALSIFGSFYFSKHITRSVTRLTRKMEYLVANDFKSRLTIPHKGPDDEIRSLYKSFNKMMEQLTRREKERDNAVRALQDGEKKFRELSDFLPEAVFEVNRDFDFTYVNRTFEEQMACSREQALSRWSLSDFVMNVTDDFYDRLRRGETMELYLKGNNNIPFKGLIRISKIYDMEEIRGYRGVVVDISRHKDSIQK